MIPSKTIERVLDAAEITEVVSDYVKLTKKGASFVGKCPFHDDKSPSFYVSPSKNVCKCFACGEGGSPVVFLMKKDGLTFVEAIKQLARKYNIEIQEREQTPEETKETLHREALYILNGHIQDFFTQNYKASEKAKTYVSKRWDDQTCQLMGIGYAKEGWSSLLDYAIEKQLNTDLLLELGLLKKKEDTGKIYDALRDRITIPILSKYGRIEGFTARALKADDKTPKYINSCDSLIYNKSESLFGYGQGFKEIIKQDRAYVVEGASDAMRMMQIKACNTVAPLGTGLTTGHLKMISRLTKRVTFIPDADTPGINAVKKHGKEAMKNGFSVTILEVPPAEDGEKQDPDTYIVNKSILESMEETDFVIWYAQKGFRPNIPVSESEVLITEICEMLAPIKSETTIDQYIDKLSKIYGKSSLWKKALERVRRELNGEKNKLSTQDGKIDTNVLRKYGFFEKNGCYMSFKKESEVQWCNFTMYPMFHIRDAINPRRMYRIKNAMNHEQIIEMKQEELISLARFKLKVEGIGNYIWEATEAELIKLKKYLYEQTETASEVTQLGWHKKGFYAFGNGIYDGVFFPADEFGIVRLDNENFYLPSSSKIYAEETKLYQFERRFVHLPYNTINIYSYTQKLIDVFGDNAKVGMCFLIASLFRDIIVSYTKSFPILNLFGPKGAGKSELGHSLMSFFIIKNTPPNISNATIPALADAVAQCSNAVVHLDEFKNNLERDKYEFLKGLWDGTGRSRMNMDRDKKREITSVDCGVVISGQEMATADIALFSRFVYLCFNQTEYTTLERNRFDELKRIEGTGLTHLTLEILSHRAKIQSTFVPNYKICATELQDALGSEVIEDRIYRNWLILLAVYKSIERYIRMPFDYNDLLQVIKSGLVKQNAECKQNNELAGFWNTVNFLAQDGEIFIDSDYRIESNVKMSTNKIKWEGNTPRQFLLLRRSRVLPLYQKHGKMTGQSTLPDSALKHYLETSKEYLGAKNSVRFKSNINGYEEKKMVGLEAKTITRVDQAMVFDLEMLRNNYGIDLSVYTDEIYDEIDD